MECDVGWLISQFRYFLRQWVFSVSFDSRVTELSFAMFCVEKGPGYLEFRREEKSVKDDDVSGRSRGKD